MRFLPIACWVAISATSGAQSSWMDWTDETSSRLVGAPTVTTTDTEEKDLCIGDFDGDGDLDLVVGRKAPFFTQGGRADVLFMNESGVLTDRTFDFAPDMLDLTDTWDVQVIDADGDGWLDIVTAQAFDEAPRLYMNLGTTGQGGGQFQGFEYVASEGRIPGFPQASMFTAVSVGDVDNDGAPDLFFSDFNNTLEDRLLINDGSGFFTDESATRLSTAAAESVFGSGSVIFDFNKDGWADILKSSGAYEPVKLLINDQAGAFGLVQKFMTSEAVGIAAGDFDNDNRMDFYVVDDEQDYILFNTGTQQTGELDVDIVSVTSSERTRHFGGSVRVEDVDRDGYLDVAVADADALLSGCLRRMSVLQNGQGHAAPGLSDPNEGTDLPWNTEGTFDTAWIDLNEDGFLDMIQASCAGLSVWLMQAPAILETPYCQSAPNSTGDEAHIHVSGSVSEAANDFHLMVRGGVPGEFGLFFYGSTQTQSTFGDGFRCVSSVAARVFPPGVMGASLGLTAAHVNFDAHPLLESGSTWNFQWWYRDPAGPGGDGFNLSDAVEVTFAP